MCSKQTHRPCEITHTAIKCGSLMGDVQGGWQVRTGACCPGWLQQHQRPALCNCLTVHSGTSVKRANVFCIQHLALLETGGCNLGMHAHVNDCTMGWGFNQRKQPTPQPVSVPWLRCHPWCLQPGCAHVLQDRQIDRSPVKWTDSAGQQDRGPHMKG